MANPLLRPLKVSEKICEYPDENGVLIPYHIREMGADELDAFEEMLQEDRKNSGVRDSMRGVRALLVCFSACDGAGLRYFDEEKDLPLLRSAPGHLLDPLFARSIKWNHRGKADVEAAAKNSASAPA